MCKPLPSLREGSCRLRSAGRSRCCVHDVRENWTVASRWARMGRAWAKRCRVAGSQGSQRHRPAHAVRSTARRRSMPERRLGQRVRDRGGAPTRYAARPGERRLAVDLGRRPFDVRRCVGARSGTRGSPPGRTHRATGPPPTRCPSCSTACPSTTRNPGRLESIWFRRAVRRTLNGRQRLHHSLSIDTDLGNFTRGAGDHLAGLGTCGRRLGALQRGRHHGVPATMGLRAVVDHRQKPGASSASHQGSPAWRSSTPRRGVWQSEPTFTFWQPIGVTNHSMWPTSSTRKRHMFGLAQRRPDDRPRVLTGGTGRVRRAGDR